MKSNEYNNVTVNNEKGTLAGEYTNAQSTEYSFQSDNPTTIKDELNDRHTVNDNPEENLLKSTKKKEEKKKENKESDLSSSGSEAATSTASATASSAGGTIAGVAASAATAAVVVIGAVAGISIIEEQKEQEDLITFVSSEIGTDNIDFVFRMPASLLSYDDQMSDTPSKRVVGHLENDAGEAVTDEQEYAFEEIDEHTLEGYGGFDGLSANTLYVLKITLYDYKYGEDQEIEVTPTDLTVRAFTTLPVTQLITFTSFEVTYNSLDFEFIVAFSDVGYVPGGEVPSAYATLGDRSLTLTDFSRADDEHALVHGGFTGLDPETSYQLEIYVVLDETDKFLGSRSFTTPERESSFVFEYVNVARTVAEFSFSIDKAEIGYEEGTTPIIRYDISNGSDYSDSSYLEDFVEITDQRVSGEGSFSTLPLNDSFTLEIVLEERTGDTVLGSTTFDNNSGFRWVIDPTKQVTTTGTLYNFAIKKAYIGYISDEETPDVIEQIHAEVMLKEGGTAGAYRLNTINNYSTEYCTCIGNIDGLMPETDYILKIYYQPDNEDPELLGSYDFTTKEDPTGLIIGDIESSSSWANIPFEINSSYVDLSGTNSNIRVIISYGGTEVTRVFVSSSSFTEKSGTNKLEASVRISDLPANTIFYAQINNANTGATYGGKEFATSQSEYGFQVTNITSTTSYMVDIDFYVDATAFDIDWSDSSAVTELEDQIYLVYGDYQPQGCYDLQRTSSDVAEGKFNITGLTPSTKYTVTAYYQDDNSVVTAIGMFEFTTKAGVTNVESGPNNSFYVVEDGNSFYRTPIRITYTGGGSDFGDNFIINLTTEGMGQPITASVSVREGYQYALFDALTISRYFGETMTFTITCDEDTDTVLYEDQVTIVDVSQTGENTFLDAIDIVDQFTDSNPMIFSFLPICALGVPSLLEDATLVITGGNTTLQYVLDLSTYGYVSSVSVDLLVDKDHTVLSYSELKRAWEYQPITIEIVYRANATTGDTTTFVVASGIMFNFVD